MTALTTARLWNGTIVYPAASCHGYNGQGKMNKGRDNTKPSAPKYIKASLAPTKGR